MKSIKNILNAVASKANQLAKKERAVLGKVAERTLEDLAKKKTPKDVFKDAAIAIGVTVAIGDGMVVPILTGALADAVITGIARKIVANKNKKSVAEKKPGESKGKPRP